MQIIQTLTNQTDNPLALTIGNFDGVHIGHQKILQTLTEQAGAKHLTPAAMTFSPHAKVFFGQANNFLINSDAEKAALIAKQGMEQLYQIPFDQHFANIEPEIFVTQLIDDLHVKHLLIGDDFRFGCRGRGDFELLNNLCGDRGVTVQHTPTISLDSQRVSSSRIREMIINADFVEVQRLLGRALCYQGIVIAGRQLGRTIDFPTANIALPKTRLLPNGVFAVNVRIEGDEKLYQGMCNIGTKPTVDDSNTRQIETHIFDFDDDLYGKMISVMPVVKLRDEQKFDGVNALVAQLHQDKETALKLCE